MTSYISLDIETTGFNPEDDQLIEFAGVKFNENKVIETFQTLINPEKQIPPMISHITGITNEMLENSPTLQDVSEKILNFIGESVIVGHNINFDIDFLNQKGILIENKLYDTLQLSSILLPNQSSYSLESLTRTLKIKHKEKHRALSDSFATYSLFKILLKEINKLDTNTLIEINKLLQKSDWPLKTLFEIKNIKIKKEKTKITPIQKSSHTKQKSKQQIENELNNFFNKNGTLSKSIPNYEIRPSQIKISEKILDAFNNNYHCIIEAGTGSGKTLAYLVSSAKHHIQNGNKIIISTHTKNLQDQIKNNDLKILNSSLKKIDEKIKLNVTTLKGRNNYISIKKLNSIINKPKYEDHETTFLIKTLIWLNKTEEGDLEELNLLGKELTLKEEVSCDEYSEHETDEKYKNYLKNAKLKAENADIVIVNHALVIRDLISNSKLIPEHNFIIFDEAHHLENVATESLTINLSLTSFARPYEKLIKIISNINSSNLTLNINTKAEQIKTRTEICFGLLGIFIEKHAPKDAYQSQFIIKEDELSSIAWNKVKQSAEIINELSDQLQKELQILINRLKEDQNKKETYSHITEIKHIKLEIEKKQIDLKTVILNENLENRINWVQKTYEGLGCIKSAPFQIGKTLKELLYNTKQSIILTSATLQTDNSFNYIKDTLNLDEQFEEIALKSHFKYPEQVKIIVAKDIPRPMTEGYFKSCVKIINDVVIKNNGRTLVLFTSKKALTATYMTIAPILREKGYEVLGQGISGGRGKIIESFKSNPKGSVIFGTDSFWEGIDISGDMLTCIIMQKLPFDPPSDPIIAVRSGQFNDSFNEYQVPRAILKFKQGFGRLIRTEKDKGSMIILDSRIGNVGYGKRFLNSLPEGINIQFKNTEEIADTISN